MDTRRLLATLAPALLAAGVAVLVDRALLRDPPARARPPAPAAATPARRPAPVAPAPIDPGPARGLAVGALAAAGVPTTAIHHGRYPLRGPGYAPDATFPLLSFTCPAATPCGAILETIAQRAPEKGLMLVDAAVEDRPGRPVYRALTSPEGRPALAIRGFPAGPRLTLVVSDVGRDPGLLDALLGLDEDVTYAVAADAPGAAAAAERLGAAGREVVALLPLGEGAPLHAEMTAEAVTEATRGLLGRVPGSVGAAPAGGERFTASRPHMTAVLEVLGEDARFFFDGVASPASVAAPAARTLGVRTAVRTHHLDLGDEDVGARLRAVEVALVLDGQAVVVTPPQPELLLSLAEWMRGLRARRIHLLRLSEIVL